MRIKTFEVVDMKQALDRVRKEMGPEAIIVSTRSVRKDRGLFGLLGRTVLEVTAAIEETKQETPPSVRASLSGELPTRSRGQGLYREVWAVKQAVDPVLDEVRALRESVGSLDERLGPNTPDLRSDLTQIRTLLASLVGEGKLTPDPQGASAQRLFYFLLERGIDEPLARSLVQRVVARVESGALGDLDRLKLNLAAEMRADLGRAERGAPPGRVQIFVGPSGVGKTTTIAKLAARAVYSSPGNVLIVTTDTHRVAAVEQMTRFGEILGVPVVGALGPEDLTRILSEAEGMERILIDTPGRSHRNRSTFGELRELADAAGEPEILLVFPATARPCDSREILEAYSTLPWSRLVITKLDESRVYGELFNAVV
ncbi:MAG: flagellar biosynthesis protein FlhF, partial [Myxococcota bacterium]